MAVMSLKPLLSLATYWPRSASEVVGSANQRLTISIALELWVASLLEAWDSTPLVFWHQAIASCEALAMSLLACSEKCSRLSFSRVFTASVVEAHELKCTEDQ